MEYFVIKSINSDHWVARTVIHPFIQGLTFTSIPCLGVSRFVNFKTKGLNRSWCVCGGGIKKNIEMHKFSGITTFLSGLNFKNLLSFPFF